MAHGLNAKQNGRHGDYWGRRIANNRTAYGIKTKRSTNRYTKRLTHKMERRAAKLLLASGSTPDIIYAGE